MRKDEDVAFFPSEPFKPLKKNNEHRRKLNSMFTICAFCHNRFRLSSQREGGVLIEGGREGSRRQTKARQTWLGTTCYATQQPQGGRVAAVLVDHAFCGGLGHRDRQGDRFVKLPSPRFYGDNGAHGHAVAEELRHELGSYRLSLKGGTRLYWLSRPRKSMGKGKKKV